MGSSGRWFNRENGRRLIDGVTIEGVATDEANRRSLDRLTLLSFLVCGVILLVASRNLRVMALLLGIAIFD